MINDSTHLREDSNPERLTLLLKNQLVQERARIQRELDRIERELQEQIAKAQSAHDSMSAS